MLPPLLSLRHTHSLRASREWGGPHRGLTLTQRTREAEEEGERKQRSFAQGSAVAIWSSLSGWWPKLPGEEKLENVLLLVQSSVEGATGAMHSRGAAAGSSLPWHPGLGVWLRPSRPSRPLDSVISLRLQRWLLGLLVLGTPEESGEEDQYSPT